MQYLGATEIYIESVNSSSNKKDVNTDQSYPEVQIINLYLALVMEKDI